MHLSVRIFIATAYDDDDNDDDVMHVSKHSCGEHRPQLCLLS